MNVNDALKELEKANITNSIQTLRRWLREGKIKAERTENRKEGYFIVREDLKRFIDERTGADLVKQTEHWKEMFYHEREYRQSLCNKFEALQKKYTKLEKEYNKIYSYHNENVKLKRELNDLREEYDLNIKLLEIRDKKINELINENASISLGVDYKKMLGLKSNATNQEIKDQFKKILALTHPDKKGNDKLFISFKNMYDEFRRTC